MKSKTIQKELFGTKFTKEGVIPIFQNLGENGLTDIVNLPVIPWLDYINFINYELQRAQGVEITEENTSGLTLEVGETHASISMLHTETNIVYQVSKMAIDVWVDFFLSQHSRLIEIQ